MRAVLFCFAAAAAFAQTASLRGVVADESGAVVPGAVVTLSGAAGPARTARADSSGAYSFAALAPGDYTLRASAPDLGQKEPVKLSLTAGPRTLNLTLKVVTLAQKVTVEANSAPALSTDAANNASALVISGSDLDALPDDPDDLAADLQALAGPSAGPNGGSIFVDGFSGGELPPKASIREIRVNQNPFSPEYDKLGYGKIEIFTKPGADKYRGTINYNFANQFWNTRNPYAPVKAPFLLNELEGEGGGPLGKKASFALDAQRNMVDNGSVMNAVTVNPQTLATEPFSGFFSIPGRYTKVSPRLDYQLSASNTLMLRYGITHSDVRDNGIGGFDIATRGYHSQFTNTTVQAADTVTLGSVINETRFQFYRSAPQSIANSNAPAIQVLGAFNGGGSTLGQTFDKQNSYEFQNYTSALHGAHAVRFGVRVRGATDDSVSPQNFNGTFTFAGDATESSIERYRRTLLYTQGGDTPAQIRALGGGATQFTMNAGTPALSVGQWDIGIFAGDEWRVRPNLTVDYGFRYETQSNIHDWRDFAPRLAFAWAPGSTAKVRGKTVVRGGFGMFYDRFPLANTLTAGRFNGIVQQQYVIPNPDFFPNAPSPAALSAFASTQVIQEISGRVRAPYIMQTAGTLERQLPANSTLAVTYTNSHGLHLLRSEDINAPLPGSGAFPLGRSNPVFLMESAGLYNQNQIIANVNSKINSGLSLFGFYVFNRARSNTDGVNTFPANPYNWSGEYGRASTDVPHRVTFGGSVNLRWAIRISPFLVAQSGDPFNITAGSNLYGTTLFNGRPGIATDPTRPGLIQTAYGLLDPNPIAGEMLLPRNSGRGPMQIQMNLRLTKTIGWGRVGEHAAAGGGTPSSAGAAAAAATGRGLNSIIGTPSTPHRFNLSFGFSVRNLLNHTNPGLITGNITSPYFGLANQVAGGPNGEGFFENANNRRLESQMKLTF
ncbi:MAG TPA: carboxypeptidase regulatory-like domain-containing protein [Candidatus Limnocylindrales bacterium]|nr:carboxypeptidase regulatory-like domain-containing protein [Candidatus Limnocylindrales bacterium]